MAKHRRRQVIAEIPSMLMQPLLHSAIVAGTLAAAVQAGVIFRAFAVWSPVCSKGGRPPWAGGGL